MEVVGLAGSSKDDTQEVGKEVADSAVGDAKEAGVHNSSVVRWIQGTRMELFEWQAAQVAYLRFC